MMTNARVKNDQNSQNSEVGPTTRTGNQTDESIKQERLATSLSMYLLVTSNAMLFSMRTTVARRSRHGTSDCVPMRGSNRYRVVEQNSKLVPDKDINIKATFQAHFRDRKAGATPLDGIFVHKQ